MNTPEHTPPTGTQLNSELEKQYLTAELVRQRGQDWVNQNRAMLDSQWEWAEEVGLTQTDEDWLRSHPQDIP